MSFDIAILIMILLGALFWGLFIDYCVKKGAFDDIFKTPPSRRAPSFLRRRMRDSNTKDDTGNP